MTRFSDIVTKPEQVEVAIAKAQIAWVTAQACSVVKNLPEFFDARLDAESLEVKA